MLSFCFCYVISGESDVLTLSEIDSGLEIQDEDEVLTEIPHY